MGGRGRRGHLNPIMRRFFFRRNGNVSPIMALMLVPIIGAFGMAAEGSRWFVAQRGAQNAADAAVIAAARNACDPSDTCHTTALQPTFEEEARSVTSKFGFTHDGGDVDVTATNTWPCPGGGNTCYSVLVTLKSPVYLTRIAGFSGDATAASGQPAQTITALAVAQRMPGTSYCITAYSSDSQAIRFNGTPSLDLTGCDLLAPNGGASCNAHSGDTIRYADVGNVGDGKNCGTERSYDGTATDYYAGLASSIPSNSCSGSYPQRVKTGQGKDHLASGSSNYISGSQGTQTRCGDVELSADVTFTGNSTLTIYNGWLNLGGHKLTVASGGSLTIILTGTAGNFDHTIVDIKKSGVTTSGVIDYSAPDSGTWSGVAIYQNPALTQNINMTVSGNNPQFNITGLIYASKAQIEISGAINHATAGDACIAFVVNTLLIQGDGSIFANPTRECDRAGLTELNRVIDKVVLVQ